MPTETDPRWHEVYGALRRLCTKGVLLWWIRAEAEPLLELESVKARAAELAAQGVRFEPGSDGRAEALVEILRSRVQRVGRLHERMLLSIVLDLDGQHRERTAQFRRTQAGQEFRGRDAKPIRASAIRQIHEPRAIKHLTILLLAYEDEHLEAHGAAEPAQA